MLQTFNGSSTEVEGNVGNAKYREATNRSRQLTTLCSYGTVIDTGHEFENGLSMGCMVDATLASNNRAVNREVAWSIAWSIA